jgi:uncharacterized membrane protein
MEENEKRDLEDIEYYSNTVNAWFNTRLEKDKSILAISAGALGLLITLLTAFGVNNITELIIYFAAILCFMLAIVFMVIIFNRNASYLSKLNKGKTDKDSVLTVLDHIGFGSFILGIIFSFIIGCSLLFSSLNINMEEKMEKETKQTTVPTKKSFNNASSMRPQSQQSSTSNQNTQNQNNSQNQSSTQSSDNSSSKKD